MTQKTAGSYQRRFGLRASATAASSANTPAYAPSSLRRAARVVQATIPAAMTAGHRKVQKNVASFTGPTPASVVKAIHGTDITQAYAAPPRA